MMIMLEDYKVDVPEGKSGEWEIKRFTVNEREAKLESLRATLSGRGCMVAGTYTGLYRSGWVIMSDTGDEIRDHLAFIYKATGNVLINGLGIGMCLDAVARKPNVTHVTVVEKSDDVLALSAHHYLARYLDKITIVHADANLYKPPRGVRYGAVWHDIWDDINTDNLTEMRSLRHKYSRMCDWQGCWSENLIKRRK